MFTGLPTGGSSAITESGELRFNHLVIAAMLGRSSQVMDLLEDYLETRRWFSTWFLRRTPELKQLEDIPRYQKIIQSTEEKEAQYWQDGTIKPIGMTRIMVTINPATKA